MVRFGVIGALLLAGLAPLSAQEAAGSGEAPDGGAVLSVVQGLFDAMRSRDSAAVRAVLHPEARLFATGERGGLPSVQVVSADEFVAAIGSGREVWDEPFWDPVVQIRDPLATVWTKYAFYRGDSFSHCGVDAFILARTEGGWKIVSIADTRQSEGCELPPGRR